MNFFNKLKQKYIFNFGSTKRRFEEIYKANFWSSEESISGPGSQLDQTETIRKELPLIFKELNIQSLLDIPCGDFHWMKLLDLKGIKYIGSDIVTELIEKNKMHFRKENVEFMVLDLIQDKLPMTNAVLVRDCFIHLSETQIVEALKNIKRSGIKYLITNNFPDFGPNFNIKTGMFRKVNLSAFPYVLGKPMFEIEEKEHFSDIDGRKTIAVYNCVDINIGTE